MKFERFSETQRYRICWLLIFAAGLSLLLHGITLNSLWYDEAFTGSIVRRSFADIVHLSVSDNHPPFFFFLARLMTLIFGNNAFVLRVCSTLGVLALALLGLGPVKRVIGSPASLLYTILMFALPAMVNQAQNARMYTWAPFFVTAAVVYAHLAVTQNKRRDWILFAVATVLGLYTHIYLIIECFVLFILLFGWIVACDRSKLRAYFVVSGISLLLYLPWLFVVALQSVKVAKQFWIPEPAGWVFRSVLLAPFQHELGSTTGLALVLLPFCLLGLFALVGVVRGLGTRGKNELLVLLGGGVAVGTFAGVLIVTYVLTPILWGRYFISLVGLYGLIVAYGLCVFSRQSLRYTAVVAVLLALAPQVWDIKTVPRNGSMDEVRTYLAAKVKPGDIFLYGDEQPFGIFVYYYPYYKHHLVLPEDFAGYANYEAFRPTGTHGYKFGEFIRDASRVWVVNRSDSIVVPFRRLNTDDIIKTANMYKASVTKNFSQPHALLRLEIDLLSANSEDKIDDTTLSNVNMKSVISADSPNTLFPEQ